MTSAEISKAATIVAKHAREVVVDVTVQVATRYAHTDTLITTLITYYLYAYVHKNTKIQGIGSRIPRPPRDSCFPAFIRSIDRSIGALMIHDVYTDGVTPYPLRRAIVALYRSIRRGEGGEYRRVSSSSVCARGRGATVAAGRRSRATRRRSTGEAKGSKGKQRTRSPTRRTTRCARASRNHAPDRDGRRTPVWTERAARRRRRRRRRD